VPRLARPVHLQDRAADGISCDVDLDLSVLAAERHRRSDEPFPICVSRRLQRLVFLLERLEGDDRAREPTAAQKSAISAIVGADFRYWEEELCVHMPRYNRRAAGE
jgi:hypothetical protein